MKYILSFSLLFLFFTSCEDKKKSSEVTPKSTAEKVKIQAEIDSLSEARKLNAIKKNTPAPYPKITPDNVVEFLTEYGNNNPETKVLISTTEGDIEIKLLKDTPLHRANFIYLVKQQYFDNTFFYRVVQDFIIQAGNSDNVGTQRKRSKIGGDYLIPSEVKKGKIHRYGTVSGAKEYRKNPNKLSFPFEFFIFVGPLQKTKHLNGDYTVFGSVTKGMDIAEKISKLPADEGEWPLANVYVLSATVID
ncbi:MAG: peptidyl-prolyl cis-trans isomerase A (cyclophilin A) [Flavobacteriaceae bacterium]|jgi:peptidyl-prolyl cis-trans isomerase A (cyclophilin A)|uniref:peptidylprolyl isomerase n=1 Tax=Candidatus Marifrigoribacter sp. Uisw_064 TaxID=3230970 RepID=UPI003ADD454E